jgi:hypothetical protein
VLVAETRTIDDVVAAVSRAYTSAGGTTVECELSEAAGIDVPGRAVVAMELGVVECVLGDDGPFDPVGRAVSRMAASGWAVTVVVPSGRLGDAHRDLRGRPGVVQGFWRDGDGVQFGRHEVL